MRRYLPPVHFITIHYAYFFATTLVSAVIIWGSATPDRSVRFIDALFLAVSAMTLAGLNTINLSTLNTFQQFWLFLLIIIGSAIFVSSFVVQVRKHAFETKFRDVIEQRKRRRPGSRRRSRSWSISRRSTEVDQDEERIHGADGEHLRDTGAIDEAAASSRDDVKGQGPSMYSTLDGKDEHDESHKQGDEVPDIDEAVIDAQSPTRSNPAITFKDDVRFGRLPQSQPAPIRRRKSSLFSMQGVGALPRSSLDTSQTIRPSGSRTRSDGASSHIYEQNNNGPASSLGTLGGWTGRNSQFHGLTDKEREELGGYEYHAVRYLSWLVPIYFVLWQLLGGLGCAAWVARHRPDTARNNGLNPWWVGAFNAISAFNNSGMSLLDANMTAFQDSFYLLITMSLLILAGNTCYPIFLRLIVWMLWKISSSSFARGPKWEKRVRTLRFLLDHPRRCYTNMFPAQHTWWLLLAVVTLNSIDWAAFEILNIGNEVLTKALPTNIRVIDGLFQAFAVRSGGFYVVAIPTVRISLQVLYVVMMYISVYPVVITMRNSNVYEERSLGIYANTQDDDVVDARDDAEAEKRDHQATGLFGRARLFRDRLAGASTVRKESNKHFVQQQLRAQLAHDLWWMVLALFLIMIIESNNFERDPATFSVFNFIFEIVSGYGCVGISVGVPYDAYSFCGSWHTLSKLILCAVMLRGRHRGLPVAIDKAVTLPDEDSWRAEEEDGQIRLARTVSRGRQEEA